MKLATNPRRFTLLLVTAVGLLITGCDCGRRPWPRTQVRLNQPNRASTGAASTSKAAEVTVTAYRFYNEVGGVYDVLGLILQPAQQVQVQVAVGVEGDCSDHSCRLSLVLA